MRKESAAGRVTAYINSLPGDSVFRVAGLPAVGGPEDLAYRKAEQAAQAGDVARALAAFRVYLRRASGADASLFPVFNACCLTGDFDRAFRALARINRLPFSTEQKLEIANPWYCVYDQDLLRGLAARLETGVKARPAPYGAVYLLTLKSAAGLDCGAQLREVMRHFRRSGAGFGAKAWIYFKAAETALNLGACAEAAEVFRRLLRVEPHNLQARGRLAETLLCLGRRQEALAAFGKSGDPSLAVWHGELLLWLGRYAQALKKFSAPGAGGHHLAWCWRGAALFKAGRLAEALENLDRAVALRPGDTEALVWRAEALEVDGRRGAALADLKAALEINPGNFWARAGITLYYLAEGDLANALANFKLPPDLTARLARSARLKPKNAYSPQEMEKLLLRARELARGCRRHEPYLLPLWLP